MIGVPSTVAAGFLGQRGKLFYQYIVRGEQCTAKSEAFADSLENQCSLNSRPDDDDHEQALKNEVRRIGTDQEFQGIRLTTP